MLPRRMAALEKRAVQAQKEQELIEKKMQRIEKAKESEVGELRPTSWWSATQPSTLIP